MKKDNPKIFVSVYAGFLILLVVMITGGCAFSSKRTSVPAAHFSPDTLKVIEATGPARRKANSLDVIPMHSIEGGIYSLPNGIFSKLVLELKGGHYRYWFSSDTFNPRQRQTYPLEGKNVSKGAVVTLEQHQPPLENVWVFRKLNGQTTLWRPNAVQSWDENHIFDSYGILYPVQSK